MPIYKKFFKINKYEKIIININYSLLKYKTYIRLFNINNRVNISYILKTYSSG
jgi:hypothetical protein